MTPPILKGAGQEPPEFNSPSLFLPQKTITMTEAVVEPEAAAAAVAVPVPVEEPGGLRLPGAPAAPAAAGGSGCWAYCSPGCCCWVCSLASLLWVGAKATEPEGPSPSTPSS